MSLHPLNQIVETARNAALSSQSAVARSLHMSTVIGSLPFDSKIKLDHIPVSAQFLATNPIVNPGLDRFMHEMSSAVASLEAKMGYLT